MIGFVDKAPEIDLQGEHFLVTVASGDDKTQFLLTATAFFQLKRRCAEAYAKRQIAEMEARERVVQFPGKARRRSR